MRKKSIFIELPSLCFKQWRNKGFACFSSISKVVKICCLTISYSLLMPSGYLFSQVDSIAVTKNSQLDEIIITGERTPEYLSRMAKIVIPINSEEISFSPVASISGIINTKPSVDIKQRGANGIQADLSIRGGTFDQALVMLNGINVCDPQTGHYNLNLPIDLENLAKVEILNGPAARTLGINAFSGAVNFITLPSPTNYLSVSLSGGSHNTWNGSFTINQNLGKSQNLFTFGAKTSDGFMHNTDYQSKNFFIHSLIPSKKVKINIQAGALAKEYGANSFYSPKYLDQYEYNETYFSSVKATTQGKISIEPSVYWRRHFDHYILIKSDPKFYQNYHVSDVLGFDINSGLNSNLGKTNIGASIRKEIINSTSLGKPLNDTVKVMWTDGDYTKKDERTVTSFFIDHVVTTNNLRISGGVMANYITFSKSFMFNPGIDIAYSLNNIHNIFLHINKGVRIPTFTDLYYKDKVSVGNPNLKPEGTWMIETGYKATTYCFSAQTGIYFRRGTNTIDWEYNNDDKLYYSKNVTKLNSFGFEINSKILLDKLINTKYLKYISLGYSYINLKKENDTIITKYSIENLRNKLNIDFNHLIINNLQATWQISYQDRNGSYLKYNIDTKTDTKTTFDPFWLVNVKLIYSINNWQFWVNASNLFNTSYIDIGNIKQPGIWAMGGVKCKVNW